MIRPAPRAGVLFLLGLPIALLPVLVSPSLWGVWLAYTGAVALLLGADAILTVPTRRLMLEITTPATLHVGEPGLLHLMLRVKGGRTPLDVDVVCDLDRLLEPQPPVRVRIAGGEPGAASLGLRPLRRGLAEVRTVWLRWPGPLGLIQRQDRREIGREIPVLPDLRPVRAAALRFTSQRSFLSGLKPERHAGDGSEFETLREHRSGLDSRAIHWKASARHRKLLSREFRAERDHQIILAVDTGRLMQETLEGVPKLDHAVSAALLLAYVCLRSGDRVGLFGFDQEVRHYLEPRGSSGTYAQVQKACAHLTYHDTETNFTLGLAELSARLRRRSLVVLLTDFVDTVTAELMVENLDRLSQRHLVLFVTLRDPGIASLATAAPAQLPAMARAVVASDLLREREIVLRRLGRLGIHTLDIAPGELSTALLNRYLDIKRRELIA